MVAVGIIIKWSLLINDTNRCLMSTDCDFFYIGDPLSDHGMQLHGAFDRCLGMKLSWEGDFK